MLVASIHSWPYEKIPRTISLLCGMVFQWRKRISWRKRENDILSTPHYYGNVQREYRCVYFFIEIILVLRAINYVGLPDFIGRRAWVALYADVYVYKLDLIASHNIFCYSVLFAVSILYVCCLHCMNPTYIIKCNGYFIKWNCAPTNYNALYLPTSCLSGPMPPPTM